VPAQASGPQGPLFFARAAPPAMRQGARRRRAKLRRRPSLEEAMRFPHCCIALALAGAGHAYAQQYPARPVRVLIPFTAGSAADIIARAMEPQMREKLAQSLVIDNRGGAGGNIAAELTAKSPPDGYTIMMGTIGTHAINYSLYSKLPYHPLRDFTPIALVGESPNVLVLNPRVPANSIRELIALAKAKPGFLNYGSSGAGTSVHLSAELFDSMAGVKMVHVPFKGASEALTALLSGETDLMFASLSSAIPLIKSGRLKAFGVTGTRRSPSVPELPTIAEIALPGFDAVAWYGLLAPAGVAKNIVATLNGAALAALATPEVKNRLFASGVEVRTSTPDEFTRLIEREMQKWAVVVKASGAKVD
jgi:tripartite-type tricarboxylate transporter receptor subunit TctC